MYGALRMNGLDALAATGRRVARRRRLPLANVHVALAGYADLPMAAYYTLAALATWRWSLERSVPSAVIALLFAIACTTIKTPGIVWALTLLPGVVRRADAATRAAGRRGIGWPSVLLALAVLAQTHPMVLGYRLHLDFAPAWQALVESLFLLGNWNLLWYAVIAAAHRCLAQFCDACVRALSSTMARACCSSSSCSLHQRARLGERADDGQSRDAASCAARPCVDDRRRSCVAAASQAGRSTGNTRACVGMTPPPR